MQRNFPHRAEHQAWRQTSAGRGIGGFNLRLGQAPANQTRRAPDGRRSDPTNRCRPRPRCWFNQHLVGRRAVNSRLSGWLAPTFFATAFGWWAIPAGEPINPAHYPPARQDAFLVRSAITSLVDGRKVRVAVLVFDSTAKEIRARIVVAPLPSGLALSVGGGRLYVTSHLKPAQTDDQAKFVFWQ
jgi:hypothetical protein